MEAYQVQVLRSELTELLLKQAEFVESRSFGGASDAELLAYEIRQELIHEVCDQLGYSCEA